MRFAAAGNRIMPLIDGVPAFRIGAAVRAARHSIWLPVPYYANDFRFGYELRDVAVARFG